jgi:hypothetical protein
MVRYVSNLKGSDHQKGATRTYQDLENGSRTRQSSLSRQSCLCIPRSY